MFNCSSYGVALTLQVKPQSSTSVGKGGSGAGAVAKPTSGAVVPRGGRQIAFVCVNVSHSLESQARRLAHLLDLGAFTPRTLPA